MEITIEKYHHTCHDGCCETCGYFVFVNGIRIGSIEDEDVQKLIKVLNQYFKNKWIL